MIEELWSKDEFVRATSSQGTNRAGFAAIEKALDEAHAAETTADQLRRVEALIGVVAGWLDLRDRLGKRLPATPLRRKMVAQVQQLEAQADAALKVLRIIAQGRRAVVTPGTVDGWQGVEPGYANVFFFEQALRKATDGQAVRQVLGRMTKPQHGWLADESLAKLLKKKLTDDDAHWFALFALDSMMLPPDGGTEPLLRCIRPSKVKQEITRCLSPMLANTEIAIALLRKHARVVAVPRTRYMTDLPMFAHLKDVIVRGGGRVWNDTRGVGDVASGGCVYLACTEENLLGHDMDSGLRKFYIEKTPACPADHNLDHNSPKSYYTVKSYSTSPRHYDEGYSTTIHEFAHVIHRKAMSQADKDILDHHYKHWSRGMTEADLAERVWTMPVLGAAEQRARDKMLNDIVSRRISSLLRRSATLSTAEKEDLAELMMRHVFSRTTQVPKATLTMGWEWVDGPVGITEAETARREKQGKSDTAFRAKLPGGQAREVEITMFGKTIKVQEIEAIDLPRYMQSIPTAGSPRCYASSHVEEYFAQVTCCWFGANGGEDPYTKQPRKNGQEWVRSNEPRPIVDLLERLFGDATVPNTNPRSAPL